MINELIRKIESRAWGQVKRTNGLVRTEDFNEKFAELIVRECMATCSKQAADWEGDYADAHNDGVGSCLSGIKEHFGVEE